MKKSLLALLVLLALVVIISPGIIGRLAEQSMDENLQRAAQESRELVVTSQGFERGWFSSAGRHRIELRAGRLASLLLALADAEDSAELPVLIVDTRLDHGLVPVTSLTRDKGTLTPGLGSAVSTLSLETPGGTPFAIPGTIYSKVGLTGELTSSYLLEPGSRSAEGALASWGAAHIDLTMHPAHGAVRFEGVVDSLRVADGAESLELGEVRFSGEQRPGPFGFAVGDIDVAVGRFAVAGGDGGSRTLGPLSLAATSSVSGERVSGRARLGLDAVEAPDIGEVAVHLDVALREADGLALGRIRQALMNVDPGADPEALYALVEDDVGRLLSKGVALHFERFDLTLPQGALTSSMRFDLAETDAAAFSWPAVLLALDAAADLSVAEELVDYAMAMNPQLAAAVGMGFLRRNGAVYEMQAAYRKGLLTVNGAPMPIPLPGSAVRGQ